MNRKLKIVAAACNDCKVHHLERAHCVCDVIIVAYIVVECLHLQPFCFLLWTSKQSMQLWTRLYMKDPLT